MIQNYKALKTIVAICFLICISTSVSVLTAQDWAKPWILNQQKVDLRRLGNPDVNEIPAYNSAITSLLTAKDGNIYGGTTGQEAYLFFFSPLTNKVRHLGMLPGQESIHHALAEDSLGRIYIGTGRNMFQKIELSPGEYWGQADETLWNDITSYFQAEPGGHVYRYDPVKSNGSVKLPGMRAEVEDLGIPVEHNSIYALTSNPEGTTLYGITYPDGHFFLFRIDNQTFEDLGPIDENIVFHGPERYWRSLCRDLICDVQGNVYFSGTGGMLKYYSPQKGSFQSTGQKIPGDYYPAQFYRDYAVVEYFDRDSSGKIYGGSSDGYLFVFDPDNKTLRNLGKPRADRRLRCLNVGSDGNVYLICGERPETSSVTTKLYMYDPLNPGFKDLGMVIVDRSPFYYRRGYQFDSMTTGDDGTIYLGESEYRSNLFIMVPPLKAKD